MTEENDRYSHYTNEELRKGAADFVKELEKRENTPEAGQKYARDVERMSDGEFRHLMLKSRHD